LLQPAAQELALVRLIPTNVTVAEYCKKFSAREIVVNKDYQRSDQIWPVAAQAFLIETILLDFPMPKLTLYQRTDIRTRRTIEEIVDGQQRTAALMRFFAGELAIQRRSGIPQAAGLTLPNLPDDLQESFLSYALPIDILAGANPEEIREVFRRINSYTVPLNPEEHRHAIFQGEFKWFIYELTRRFAQLMSDTGVFTEKQLIRMNDAKLFCEITHALIHGISTTSKRTLDALYAEYDEAFEEADTIRGWLDAAVRRFLTFEELHQGTLVRPHMAYTLLLALVHVERRVLALQQDYQIPGRRRLNTDSARRNLGTLADALERGEDAPKRFRSFVQASTSKTNVRSQRITRFQWMARALTEERI
jgi:hypothetical protein